MAGYKLKPCKRCGIAPVLERWASDGKWYAVRCNNPDRVDECDYKFYKSMSNNPAESARIWNELN